MKSLYKAYQPRSVDDSMAQRAGWVVTVSVVEVLARGVRLATAVVSALHVGVRQISCLL